MVVIIYQNADLIELKQLGFDLSIPLLIRSDDQEKEDTFCEDLRKVGGKWWRGEKRFLGVHGLDWDEAVGLGDDPAHLDSHPTPYLLI